MKLNKSCSFHYTVASSVILYMKENEGTVKCSYYGKRVVLIQRGGNRVFLLTSMNFMILLLVIN
jgi:hypothetical protein